MAQVSMADGSFSDRASIATADGGLPVWRLRKVQAFIESHIDAPLRLADLAAEAGLSRMYFAAKFRAATGLRPHDYVLCRRIARAKVLMATSNVTLVNIALDSGFQSQAHFCTTFKRLVGATPSTWRRQAMLQAPRLHNASEAEQRMDSAFGFAFLAQIADARDGANTSSNRCNARL